MFFDRKEAREARALGKSDPFASAVAPVIRWLVYREDNVGNRFLIAADLQAEISADSTISTITASHRKPHGQEYYKVRYPNGARSDTIRRLGIKE